jgi:2-polyprenyl-3-methyl-5-hydroxy-6-metoxy-1,4-benzoquinol methylase
VTGLEASEPQVSFARKKCGLDVFLGTPSYLANLDRKFDVIHCAHTLEHMPDPRATLQCFRNALSNNGLLVIEVPNVRSVQNTLKHFRYRCGLLRNSWRPGDFPEHLVEFTPKTLLRLITAEKFHVLFFHLHSRSVLERGKTRTILDFSINRLIPIGNNMICIARK